MLLHVEDGLAQGEVYFPQLVDPLADTLHRIGVLKVALDVFEDLFPIVDVLLDPVVLGTIFQHPLLLPHDLLGSLLFTQLVQVGQHAVLVILVDTILRPGGLQVRLEGVQ